MAMVDVDDSCQFSADSQPKSTGLVWGLAATRRSVCINQINRVNSRNDFGSWWHHHKHCHGYYYYNYNYRGLTAWTHYVENLSKLSYCLRHVKHIKFYRSKFPKSIFTFLSPFLSDQKFSLRYWRFPFVQERTNCRDAAARLSSVSRKALGALVH